MDFRDNYIKSEQVLRAEEKMLALLGKLPSGSIPKEDASSKTESIHSDKRIEKNTQSPSGVTPSGSFHDEGASSETQSLPSSFKIQSPSDYIKFISKNLYASSDEEEPMLTQSMVEEETEEENMLNVNKNTLLPIDFTEIRQEYSFPSISDLVIRKESKRGMAENSDPMTVTTETVPDELENNALLLTNIHRESTHASSVPDENKGDAKENESNIFKNMNVTLDDTASKKVGGKKKKKNKSDIYETQLAEKVDAKNLSKQKLNVVLPRQKGDLELKEPKTDKGLDESKEDSIDDVRLALQTTADNVNLSIQTAAEELMRENDGLGKNYEMEKSYVALYDDTMFASQVEVYADELMEIDSTNSKKRVLDKSDNETDNQSEINKNKKSNINYTQTPIIKMEHFFYTKEDCYKHYRHLIGLEIRRRNYLEMFKNQKTLLVEHFGDGSKSIDCDLSLGTDKDQSKKNLLTELILCMTEPCETTMCDVSTDFKKLLKKPTT